MSDTDGDIDESLQKIHEYVEQIAHSSKYMNSKALILHQLVEHPEMDVWMEPFKLHERARGWAKRNMVASSCSLWEVNKTLVEMAKKEKRVYRDNCVALSQQEAVILDLEYGKPIPIWKVLGRLPRFFV